MLLPGPPLELKPIFEHECLPRLREALPQRFIAMRTLKAAMIGESACDARIAPIYKHYPDIETTILANGGDIQLNLICEKPALDIAQSRVDELAGRIEEELDDLIYSTQGESLEEIVLLYLGMKGATLAVAESCTGGMVAERITRIPGSSRAFLGGAVVYSNELKTTFAGVDAALIAQHGAVSAEVAKAMAEGIRKKTGATTGLAVTGSQAPAAGPRKSPSDWCTSRLRMAKRSKRWRKILPGSPHRTPGSAYACWPRRPRLIWCGASPDVAGYALLALHSKPFPWCST